MRMQRAWMWRLVLAAVILFCGQGKGMAAKPKAPGQPKTGPGGTGDYKHAKVKTSSVGKGGEKAWMLEPADPAPAKAPVIIFLHGWGTWGPVVYRQWSTHLVRRGNIVIHPKYQSSHATLPSKMTANAIAGVKLALAELKKKGRVHPDETKVAVAGHSVGGVLAANLAAAAKKEGLPQPLAVMSLQPGDPKLSRFGKNLSKLDLEIKTILRDYSTIPKGTLMIVTVGDADPVVADDTAKLIWKGVRHLPAKDRDYITFRSDLRGSPKLKARHSLPSAPTKNSLMDFTRASTDAHDYYGTWKLLDGLTDAAFYNKNRKYALGNTPEQRHMGKWSDGAPVKELEVLDKSDEEKKE
jgi:pimeloyl-ACP methyl ester carboxylesterase